VSQSKVYLDRVLDKKDHLSYMFCKGGVYFGLDIANVKLMHALLGEIIDEQGDSNDSETRTT